jgi:conjugative transfer signal peptidase TraF
MAVGGALGRLGLGLAAGIAIAAAAGVRYNTSGSLPRGLYRISAPAAHPPRAFDLVVICPPPAAAALAVSRGYLDAGSCPGGSHPLGKLVVAAAGEVVELSPLGVRLGNGLLLPASRPLATDSAGRPLPHAAFGRRRLARGEIWLFAPHPRSFDSRCFGPASTAGLRGTLSPLWVTRASAADALLADLRDGRRAGQRLGR